MKKVLQILFGLLLILVLACLSFSEVSSKIKDDLLSKTKTKLIDNGITGITADLEGEGLALTRTVILTGTVNFEKEKMKATSLVEALEGVADVDNQTTIAIEVDTAPKVIEAPVVKAIVPTSKKAEKPTLLIKKEEKKVSEVKESAPEKSANKEVVEVNKIIIKLPTVPAATQKVSEVPTPIEVVKTPVAVEAEKAIESQENKNIKTQGVE